ncbi:MAG TPA: class I SAM-dependent methyltransferase [Chthoniobacterales bacterium]|jgi:SAM-dependent methyltransferase|nr:class I SAM-dependent methyltransferase [Chthoniobacterales bacterium]
MSLRFLKEGAQRSKLLSFLDSDARMSALYRKIRETITNKNSKLPKRLRKWIRWNRIFLAAGLREALELMSSKTGRSDWPKVSLRVDREDMMYEIDPTHYFCVGYSALFCVEQALEKAAKTSVKSILDFGSGHGRVLRTLAARFPHAALTAADVNVAAVDFCAKAFGAAPVYSDANFSRLVFGTRFDLIWVGSLFTHMSAERWTTLLKLFRSVLTEDGMAVFSTHGSEAERRLREGETRFYGLEPERIAKILEEHGAHGFGYSDYRKSPGYGVSLSSPEWVSFQVTALGFEPVLYLKNAWDNHHDVWAVRLRQLRENLG